MLEYWKRDSSIIPISFVHLDKEVFALVGLRRSFARTLEGYSSYD